MGVQTAEAGMAPSSRDEVEVVVLAPVWNSVAVWRRRRLCRGEQVLYWWRLTMGEQDSKQEWTRQEWKPRRNYSREWGPVRRR